MDILDQAKKTLGENLLGIEKRTDISKEDKANLIINLFAATCAGVAIQPIPFADAAILTPLQIYMGERLSAIWGVPASKSSVGTVIKDILKICGMGILAQQLAIGAYKTVLPFANAFTTIPMVYGLTYAIGSVLSEMYRRRARGEAKLTKQQVANLFRSQMKEGKRKGKNSDNN